MEKEIKKLIENDAVPTAPNENQSVIRSDVRELSEMNENLPGTMNNLLMANSTTVYKFDNCTGLHFGSNMNIGWSPGNNGAVAVPRVSARTDEHVYKKTPTIKAMIESKDPISPAFLDVISANFGFKWRDITISLQINQLFVDRMYEDYFERGGVKEVVFQVLSKYLKDHEDKAYVGWIISYLWRNGFRKTVWTVKDHYKRLQELEQDLE